MAHSRSIYSLLQALFRCMLALCRCTRTYIQYMHTIDVFGELENTKLRLIRCGWEKNQRVICILQIIIAVNLQAKLSDLSLRRSRSIGFDNFFFYLSHRMLRPFLYFFFFQFNKMDILILRIRYIIIVELYRCTPQAKW